MPIPPLQASSRTSTLVLMAGLPATGKTTLAEALVEKTGGVILNKDRIREAMFPGKWTDYTSAQDKVTMDALYSAARYLVAHHSPPFVYLDGRTYRSRQQIDEALALAEEIGCDWKILHLICSREAAKERLRGGSHIAKNRDYEMYLRLEQSFEPIERPARLVDTTLPFQQCLETSLGYLQALSK